MRLKTILQSSKSKKIIFFLVFLILSFIFIRGIIFSKGLVVGSDWMMPLTFQQMGEYIERQFYTWTYDMNLFGVKNPFFVTLPFVFLVKMFVLFGLNGEILSKALIIMIFTLSGTSMFLLLKFLGLKNVSSVVGGFIFITMPVFFNYTIMGWCFVLLAVGTILPITVICFIKSVEEKKIFYSVISGLLFSVAIIQSQSLVWFPMVFLALSFYLVKDKATFLSYAKSILIVILIALALHSSWWPNLILNHDPGVMNSDLGLDSVSLGMRSRLSVINILRAWGGLFNYQYEISYPKSLMPISFLISLMAIASLLLRKVNKRDIRIPLVVILFYMVILFFIDPRFMAKMPFSNLIRDIGRFTILTSFSYTILASFFLSYLLESVNKKKKFFAFFLLFLIFLNSFSFFSGKLYGEAQNNYDVRLRTYRFSEDYYFAENYLNKIKRDVKSYYPPSGTNIGIKNQPKLDVDFKEIKDPFRGYSPIPGGIYMYYSSMGKPPEISFLLDSLFNENHSAKYLLLMGMMNIEDIIIRNDINYPDAQMPSIAYLLSNTESKNLLNFGKVQIIKNKYFLPHFYIPQNIIYSNEDTGSLVDIVDSGDRNIRSAIFLTDNTEKNVEDLDKARIIQTADEIFVKWELENAINEEKLRTSSPGELNIKHDFSKLVYKIEIPKDGEYEIFISENGEKKNLGKKYFEKGNQELVLPIKGISENLIDKNLQIKDYISDSIYKVRFDYQTLNNANFFIKENNNKGIAQTNLSSTGEKFEHFEMYFKSSSGATNAAIHLSAPKDNNPDIKYKNVQIQRILQPSLILESIKPQASISKPQTPKITFVKINPTKYKVKVEGAKEPYNLVFSESFHQGWKAYVSDQQSAISNQQYGEVVASYFDGEIKEGTHKNIFLDRNTFETGGKKSIPEERHLLVNGYANSWYITPEDTNGRQDYEIIIEFGPQRSFYIGLFISGLTLMGCLGYLIFTFFRKK